MSQQVLPAFAGLITLALGACSAPSAPPRPAPTVTLAAPATGDQDDMCVWVHPTDPAMCTVITSDKAANKLIVYDLDGKVLQVVPLKHPGNIDNRSGFMLGGAKVDIVGVNLRDEKRFAVLRVDPATRKLERIDDGSIATGGNYGCCLFHSPKTGKFYGITTSLSGAVAQFELSDAGSGKVRGKKVRAWKVRGVCEGAVADDHTGRVYISEERRGVWELDGEPESEAPGRLVIKVGENGLKGDVEGLAIFPLADDTGYLLVSDQSKNTYRVYRREGKHEYIGSFTVVGATDTDGIEVVGRRLGPSFPNGLFACHTNSKHPCPVLLVPWERIASTFTPPLAGPLK